MDNGLMALLMGTPQASANQPLLIGSANRTMESDQSNAGDAFTSLLNACIGQTPKGQEDAALIEQVDQTVDLVVPQKKAKEPAVKDTSLHLAGILLGGASLKANPQVTMGTETSAESEVQGQNQVDADPSAKTTVLAPEASLEAQTEIKAASETSGELEAKSEVESEAKLAVKPEVADLEAQDQVQADSGAKVESKPKEEPKVRAKSGKIESEMGTKESYFSETSKTSDAAIGARPAETRQVEEAAPPPPTPIQEGQQMAQKVDLPEHQGAQVLVEQAHSAGKAKMVPEVVEPQKAKPVQDEAKTQKRTVSAEPETEEILVKKSSEPTPGVVKERPQAGQVYLGRATDIEILAERPNGQTTIASPEANLDQGQGNTQVSFREYPVQSQTLNQPQQPPTPEQSQVVQGKFPEVIRDQIASFSLTTGQGEIKVIKIRLVPEELGEVKIQLRLEGGKVSGEIMAQQAGTKELITANLPQLKATLAGQGVNLSELVVSTVGGFGQSLEGQAQRRSQNSPLKKEQRYFGDDNDLPIIVSELGLSKFVSGSSAKGLDLRM